MGQLCGNYMQLCGNYMQGRSQNFWQRGALSGAKQHIVRLASRVRRREVPPIELRLWSGGATPFGGLEAKPPENIQDFMLILDPESTCKWHSNKKSNSHSGCKNKQQGNFEVKLENRITNTMITRH